MALLETRNISRSFGALTALDNVSISVEQGEIVGIVGENGAGKSTLLNILCGTLKADSGTILLNGERIEPKNYHDANLSGIWRVFQEPQLIPGVSVYENMFLTHEDRFMRWGLFLDRKSMAAEAARLVPEMGLDIDVTQPVYRYNFAIRQAIEVAKACLVSDVLGLETAVVLLDEPTTGLTQTEVEAFLSLLHRLRSRVSLVFVSHRLSEVKEVCDRIYVLKDGVLTGHVPAAEATPTLLHELMVGRVRDAHYYSEHLQRDPESKPVVLSVRGLTKPGAFADVDLDLRQGEILGVGGLIGSGKSDLGRVLAGVSHADDGSVSVAGRLLQRLSIREAKSLGIAYLSPERKRDGVVDTFSLAANISLPSGESGPYGFTNRLTFWSFKRERAEALRQIETFQIKGLPHTRAFELSGGNQQKMVLAKWARREPQILILDSPTTGIDSGAKAEIYRLLRELASRGIAILLISDELLELIGLSNRIIIMTDGYVVQTMEAPPERKPTERELIGAMIGDSRSRGSQEEGSS